MNIISISVQPNGINIWYFKSKLFDLTKFLVWKTSFTTYGFKDIVIRKLELAAETQFL